jgi:hypothetical protein
MPLEKQSEKTLKQGEVVTPEANAEPTAARDVPICPLEGVPLENGTCPCCHRTQEELIHLGGDLYPLKNVKKSLKRLAYR